jgi:hypothetical protein
MKDETIDATIAKQYTDWHVKTGGFARDKTLRDHFAGLAMQAILSDPEYSEPDSVLAGYVYFIADAMLKERAK